jgi:hypothetical protein
VESCSSTDYAQLPRFTTQSGTTTNITKSSLEAIIDGTVLVSPMGLGTERFVKQFEECLKVEFATKTLRSGCQRGDLAESDFAPDSDQTSATATRSTTYQLLPGPDSIKARVAKCNPIRCLRV